ncbi:MAG: GAF domain-containing protein [Phycisphaerales bacterium]
MTPLPSAIADATTSDAALAAIVRHMLADSGTLHFLGADNLLHLNAVHGPLPEPLLQKIRVIPVGKGMAGACAAQNEPVTWCNLNKDATGVVQPGARSSGMEGAIVVPVRAGGKLVGTLGVANHGERVFSPEEVAFLEACAGSLAHFRD